MSIVQHVDGIMEAVNFELEGVDTTTALNIVEEVQAQLEGMASGLRDDLEMQEGDDE